MQHAQSHLFKTSFINQEYRPDNCPLNILLIEDTSTDALLTTKAIEKTNIPFTLTWLKHGNEVASLVRIEKPDLIFLDLGLPGMDGFEVLSELSLLPPALRATPIVLLTGYKNFEYIKHNYPLYFEAYINKPCSVRDMQLVLSYRQLKHYNNS